jgi:hypothetical protein
MHRNLIGCDTKMIAIPTIKVLSLGSTNTPPPTSILLIGWNAVCFISAMSPKAI